MSTQIEPPAPTPFDDAFFQHNLPQYYRAILHSFRKVARSFATFRLIYFALFLFEATLLICLIGKSTLFAFALGLFFLTSFSYCVLLFYYQAKKPEQLLLIRDQFLQSCRQLLPDPPGAVQHHLSLAAALLKLSAYLDDFAFPLPIFLQPLAPLLYRLFLCSYKKDGLAMQEILLQAAVDEHLKQIRVTPTDLEVHASLANTYVDLSQLYAPLSDSQEKFKKSVRLAIEEFCILSFYAPNDPWTHEQLADGYRAMKMISEEITEIELLAQLRPQDPEILFRLGVLYFNAGENAKGLRIYEELNRLHYKKAEELISLYGH